ncbi:unnamed protein product [Allacma fusca]|uniref:Uncharacterized protein n=1 Tax=Allacma fusca TaxID=39272 RepID=A0A8J2PSZ7_9HEXA|nr:unnamed protein product [Allacma fusca]
MTLTLGSVENGSKLDKTGNEGTISPEKRYRVKVFTGGQVYEKLFSKNSAQRISKVQVILAGVIAVCQIMTLCTIRDTSAMEGTGAGIWAPFLTVVAATCVAWTCKKITYMRLHFSMALHLVSTVAMMFLLIFVLSDSIPSTRHSLYFNYLTPNRHRYGRYGYNYNNRADIDSNRTTELPSTARHYSPEYGPIGIMIAALVFYMVMALSGLAELILSIIMASMACKAMCAGRKKIEETIFAMELAGHENPNGISVVDGKFDQGIEVSLPPPYHKVTLGLTEEDSVA